jgi:hypothetical protein
MPIEMKYVDDELGVLFIGEGIVTGEDIINSNRQFFSSEEKMIKNRYGIFDFSNITKFEVSKAELETIISQNRKVSESLADGILAVVAIENFVFGISRMWEIHVELEDLPWETNVLRSRRDAEAWIKDRAKEKFGIDDLTFD